MILLFPIKGRYLESPGWYHVPGGTKRQTTYFTGVDAQRKPQLPLLLPSAPNKNHWCEDVPNTPVGQHNNISFPSFPLTGPARLYLIGLLIFLRCTKTVSCLSGVLLHSSTTQKCVYSRERGGTSH